MDGSQGNDGVDKEELDEKYPHRPHNHSNTLPFHDLFLTLFNPLNDNKKKPTGPIMARRKQGPHGSANRSPHEIRRNIIERFISRWRKEVGNDIYPAFRLIVPEKDRDRPMYGLKEKAIGKLLVKTMKIDKNSEDGFNLLNWKLPSQSTASRMAGDFAGRCFEIISKRPMRTSVGELTVGEVNEMLDKLAAAQREEHQLPIFETFYEQMNPEELLWLIRIILRQMKVGATEKTFFDVWHPDAEALFNVSSSLRRVCWELYDPSVRLESDDTGITLMQCFQPQLAQFQMHSFERMVEKMRPAEEDDTFWVEEKMDGERMQLHMMEDSSILGGKRFGFWSRKAKDYTYLYGNGFQDENGALTRHIKDAFNPAVHNIILDGEMITWDPEQDAMVPFGTLKTAAISEQRNPFSTGQRPLFRVFDCLYLNGEPITSYTLRDRRRALEASVHSVPRRLEILEFTEAHDFAEIEPLLRKVVAEASEGLILKNPRSMYRLNERNDDWLKVKPEYMTEFGESLDCIVIGGYYGSGKRGGRLSSFLCGLKVDQRQIDKGANPMKCYSFFKVGGGFTAMDYANVRHHTDGKWKDWDSKRPPTEFIELAGGHLQHERPDVWIRPDDSVVVSVKAASVTPTDSFRMGLTLRFPRFKKLRTDRDWTTALSIQGFLDLKANVEKEQKEKEFTVDDGRKRARTTRKKELRVAGGDQIFTTPYAGPETRLFEGLKFFIITDAAKPEKKSKAELEQLVKTNGGQIFQTHTAFKDTICIAERRTVKVASLQKAGDQDIIRPSWIFDCIKQNQADGERPRFVLPVEPSHIFSATEAFQEHAASNVDEYGDSYARDVSVEELREIFGKMPAISPSPSDVSKLKEQLRQQSTELRESRGWMFTDLVIYLDKSGLSQTDHSYSQEKELSLASDRKLQLASNYIRFGDGKITDDLQDIPLTHVIVGDDRSRLKQIRQEIKDKSALPRIVTVDWVETSWQEETLLDEERFAPV
ncbi:DNA ligase 4 [Xylona heveae TC161]|uniref:DNA ligase n=1 Tax=Xylona heveae (strain CBS 132557 / TC161) TaxID=1328760 RepID=A0A165JT74_XYLHT|nr:DNA ligase 4 [Xylona heveae TC161]KZF26592.1 DNA ligase 4 [Xylona heveae TC161]